MWTPIIAGIVAILQQVFKYFSAESKLRRLEISNAEKKARESVEAERAKSRYERIAREPKKEGQGLVERMKSIQERFKK